MHETLSLSDLVELSKGGAHITIDRPPQQSIVGFDKFIEKLEAMSSNIEGLGAIGNNADLVEALQAIAASNEALAAAELARSKAQSEVLMTLQRLIKNRPATQTIDMAPMKTLLSEIAMPRERQTYEFTVKRGQGGYIEGMTAVPKRLAMT